MNLKKKVENLINFMFSNSEINILEVFNFDENINVPKKIIEQLEKDYNKIMIIKKI